VELLASTVAGVPIDAHLIDPITGVTDRVEEGMQPSILRDPDPTSTPWHWRYACVKDLIEAGNFLGLLGDPDWRTDRPGWVIPLPVAECGLLTDPARPGWWAFTIAGIVLDPSEVLHISAGNRSGEILGQGIIAQYAEQLGGQREAEQWAGRYVAGGGLPPAIIQATGDPTQERAAEFKAKWRKMMDTGEAVLLPANVTVTPLQSDAERQQLVEARKWNAQLAAMVLGIPSTYLGLEGPTMTYTNVESIDVGFIRDAVTRWSDPITATLSARMLPAGWEAKPRWAARARTDTETQARFIVALVQAGVWTVDEGRRAMGMPPMPDGDNDPAGKPAPVPAIAGKEAT
jgi:phage portal protein BeeE